MSSKKTIKINPDFFRTGKKTKKKRERKEKPIFTPSLRPNNIKKQLLQRIKQHQQKTLEEEKSNMTDEKEDKEFQNNFSNSLNYLQKMIAEKKKKKKKRATIKNTPTNYKHENYNAPTQTKTPSWGCLKNGNLPTFKQYKKTLRKKDLLQDKITIVNPLEKPSKEAEERQTKLSKLKEKFSTENFKNENKNILNKMKTKILEKNKTIKLYKLGKRIKENNIGVLIKSGKTRKIIKDEINILKQKSITEVKMYLKKHNIIKTGSPAPDSILRKLYEDSYLAGDIYNKNSDYLLHNYISI
jgi:hypothetical protein